MFICWTLYFSSYLKDCVCFHLSCFDPTFQLTGPLKSFHSARMYNNQLSPLMSLLMSPSCLQCLYSWHCNISGFSHCQGSEPAVKRTECLLLHVGDKLVLDFYLFGTAGFLFFIWMSIFKINVGVSGWTCLLLYEVTFIQQCAERFHWPIAPSSGKFWYCTAAQPWFNVTQ